jgi:hypothetical protein
MHPDAANLEDKVQTLLPSDGSAVLNRVMLVRIRQAFEASVTQAEYFKAVDSLDRAGVIGRLRGAGGQIFLLRSSSKRAKPVAEKALMEPTLHYLRREFVGLLELPETSSAIVIDTSKMGPIKGTWARPDFVLVTASTYALMPGRHIDVHSFELKNANGGSVSSVHEALAQTRFTHYGHFIWHLPRGSKKEAMMPEVLSQCEEHGIGFVRAYDPHDMITGWEVLKTPRRKATHVGIVDNFLLERLSSSERAFLLNGEVGVRSGV